MPILKSTGSSVTTWIRQRQAFERHYKTLAPTDRDAIDSYAEQSIKPLRECLDSDARPGNGFDKAVQRELQRLRIEETARRIFQTTRSVQAAVENADGRHPGMVYIPPGEVVLGVESGFWSREESQRTVFVDGFWMDTTSVTNDQYHQVYKAHTPDSHSYESDMPVVGVTWFDAAKFAGALGKRLPTQAEWERAGRGPAGWLYSFGDEFDPLCANIWPSEGARRVFEYPPNPWGLYQMSGNVWEWTADVLSHQLSGRENICYNLARGGSWRNCRWGARATMALCLDLAHRSDNVGFRCACSY